MLLVLQGLDTSGKGGTVAPRRRPVRPGRRARSRASAARRRRSCAHDFLWRIRRQLPRAGKLGVFDRSHYEDVLAVRVRKLADKRTWTRRYGAINRFEAELAEGGTRVVKCFLHISREEQRAAAARPPRRPDQALEVQPARPRRPRAVGRLHGRLRRRARALQHRGRAVAHRPRRPQVVPQLGDHAAAVRGARGARPRSGPRPTSTSTEERRRVPLDSPRVRADGSGCRGGPGAGVPGREAADDARRLSAQPQLAARGVQPVDQPRPRRPVRRGDDPRRAAPARAAALDALRQRRAGREVPPPARREPGLERRPSRRCWRC